MGRALAKAIEKINGALLAVIVVLLFLQVASRTLRSSLFLWAGEAALWIFVWVVFLGAAVLFHKREHMIVDIIEYFLPQKIRERVLTLLARITRAVSWAFLVVIFYYSILFAISVANQYAVSFRLSRVYVSAALPVSIVLMFVFEVISRYERKRGSRPC